MFSGIFEHRHDCAACVGCCNTVLYFHRAAYDILAAQQAFFHNKPADFVYVTEASELVNTHAPALHVRTTCIDHRGGLSAADKYNAARCFCAATSFDFKMTVCNVAALANSAKKIALCVQLQVRARWASSATIKLAFFLSIAHL